MTKVVAISDLHGKLPSPSDKGWLPEPATIPECDLLLISGDITPIVNHDIFFQKSWLDGPFRKWLNDIPAKEVVACAGNHDFIFQEAQHRRSGLIPEGLRWTYLEDSGCEKFGIKIWGSPWSLWFYDWAFNAPQVGGEEFLAKLYAKIPKKTDIILSHGPAYKCGDTVGGANEEGPFSEHVGSRALLQRIREIRPKLTVTGHIHGGYGQYNVDGESLVVNASIVNERYQVANRVFEIDMN